MSITNTCLLNADNKCYWYFLNRWKSSWRLPWHRGPWRSPETGAGMCKGKGGHPAWESLIHKCLLHVFEKMSLTEIINTDNHPPDLRAALLSRVKGNRIRLMVPVLTACSVQAPRIVRCPFLQHPTPHSMTTEIAPGALNIYLSPVRCPLPKLLLFLFLLSLLPPCTPTCESQEDLSSRRQQGRIQMCISQIKEVYNTLYPCAHSSYGYDHPPKSVTLSPR